MQTQTFLDTEERNAELDRLEDSLKSDPEGVYESLLSPERSADAFRQVLQELYLETQRNKFLLKTRIISPTATITFTYIFLIIYISVLGMSVGNVCRAWNTNNNCNHLTCSFVAFLIGPVEVPFRVFGRLAADN